MKFNISEEEGELSFGVFWISLDGRLNTKWHKDFKEAKKHYKHLKNVNRQPSINVRLIQ